jgi:hypothetical protein
MGRWTRDEDERDDEWDAGDEPEAGFDDEYADEDWPDEDEEEPTEPCPYCGREIHEDAQRCPYCENYLSTEDAPAPPKPWWLVVGAVAGLYAVYRWIVWYNGPGL